MHNMLKNFLITLAISSPLFRTFLSNILFTKFLAPNHAKYAQNINYSQVSIEKAKLSYLQLVMLA